MTRRERRERLKGTQSTAKAVRGAAEQTPDHPEGLCVPRGWSGDTGETFAPPAKRGELDFRVDFGTGIDHVDEPGARTVSDAESG